MKKILIKLVLVLLVCATVLMGAGCTFGIRARTSGQKIDPTEGGSGNQSSGEMGGGSKQISISIYAAGYGSKWLQNAIDVYLKNNPDADLSFKFTANPLMFETVYNKLTAGTCEDDIVIIADTYYKQLVTAGKLEDLTETVFNQNIPDDPTKKVMDVVAQSHLNYRDVNGKQYGVPWQDNVTPGFVYNKKAFEKYGWNQSPKSMSEFFDLCADIVSNAEANMYAFSFGGNADFGYFPGVLNKWFIDYYGYEYIVNTFQKYDNPSYFNATEAGRQKAYETFANLLSLKSSGKAFAYPKCSGLAPMNAQMKMLQGECAMVLCGNWFPQEMNRILSGATYKDFEYGFMPMPHINDDLMTGTSPKKDSSKDRYSLNSNSLAVPTTAKYKEEAYDFLKWMFTKESYASFVEANNGLTRPISGDIDTTGLNAFAKASFDFTNEGKQSGNFVYENSKAIMSRNGSLSMFLPKASGSDMINDIIQNPGKAKDKIANHVAAETTRAWSYWDASTNNWQSIYLIDED